MAKIETVQLRKPETGKKVIVNKCDVQQYLDRDFEVVPPVDPGDKGVQAKAPPGSEPGEEKKPVKDPGKSEGELEEMTKPQLYEYAKKRFSRTIPASVSKGDMIDEILELEEKLQQEF